MKENYVMVGMVRLSNHENYVLTISHANLSVTKIRSPYEHLAPRPLRILRTLH